MELELKTDINDYNLVGGDATETVELTKPRKKKVYTAPKTEKQLANFDKAREIRLEKIRLKKLEDQEKLIKQILDNENKIKKSPERVSPPSVTPVYVSDASDSDSDSDEEIIIKSKPKSKPSESKAYKVKSLTSTKSKPKKKTVVYLSDSDSDDDEEDEIPVPVQKSRVQRKVSNIVKQHPGMQPTEFKNYFI